MDRDDRNLLLGFLQEIQPRVQLVVTVLGGFYEQYQRDFPGEADRLSRAWGAVLERGEIGTVIQRVERQEDDRVLENAGLVGPELAFKLSGIAELQEEAGQEFRTGVPRSISRGWRLFRLMLLRIDAIWKSVLASLGVGEAFGEFKEVLELKLEQLTT